MTRWLACLESLGDCICGITFTVADVYGLSSVWPSCGEFQPKRKSTVSVEEILIFLGTLASAIFLAWILFCGGQRKVKKIAKFEQPPRFKEWFFTYMHIAHECDARILEPLWLFDYGSHGMSEAQLYHDLIGDICRFLSKRGFTVRRVGIGWRAQHVQWDIVHPDGRRVWISPNGIFLWDDQPMFYLSLLDYTQIIIRVSRRPNVQPLTHPEFHKYLFDALWDLIIDGKKVDVER
jgi:hypothetical protein